MIKHDDARTLCKCSQRDKAYLYLVVTVQNACMQSQGHGSIFTWRLINIDACSSSCDCSRLASNRSCNQNFGICSIVSLIWQCEHQEHLPKAMLCTFGSLGELQLALLIAKYTLGSWNLSKMCFSSCRSEKTVLQSLCASAAVLLAAYVLDCAELDLQQCCLLSSDNYIGEVEELATSLDRSLSCVHTRSLRV